MQDGRNTIITNSVFYKSREKVEKKIESREVEIIIKYKINITVEKRVEQRRRSSDDWEFRAVLLVH